MKSFETWDTSCWVCGDVITNPVCTECMEREVEDWLVLKNPALIPSVRVLSKIADKKEHSTTSCLFCGKMIDTCIYCFIQDVLELLQHSNPELVDGFLENFSYEAEYKQVPEEPFAM